MDNVDYKPNAAGIRALMKSAPIEGLVGQYAADVAARATSIGDGIYGSRTRIGRVSAHGYAYTGNFAAMLDNAKNDTLDAALGGAG